jgi:hypothetical protein
MNAGEAMLALKAEISGAPSHKLLACIGFQEALLRHAVHFDESNSGKCCSYAAQSRCNCPEVSLQ